MRNTVPVSTGTRDRVTSAMSELRFLPNRLGVSLAEGRHAANGIVFPDLAGPYFAEVVLGYEEAAGELDRSVIILSTHGRAAPRDKVLDLVARVDGLVVLGRAVDDELVAEVVSTGVPVVTLARPPLAGTDGVNADNASSATALAEHLLADGARRVVLLGDPQDSPDVAARWVGVRAVLESRGAASGPAAGLAACGPAAGLAAADPAAGPGSSGLPTRYSNPPGSLGSGPAATVQLVRSNGFDVAAGRGAASALLARGTHPDAVICGNDEIALGVLLALRDAGLSAPGDVAVTGWDDVMAAQWAGLTTVRQPMRELGAVAAGLLDRRIRTPHAEHRHDLLPTELVVRTSCGHNPEHPSGPHAGHHPGHHPEEN